MHADFKHILGLCAIWPQLEDEKPKMHMLEHNIKVTGVSSFWLGPSYTRELLVSQYSALLNTSNASFCW